MPTASSVKKGQRSAGWARHHLTDSVPEAISGRADPSREGRHQHSLRDLDNCGGEGTPGPQPAAAMVPAPWAPIYDDEPPLDLAAVRRVSPNNNDERAKLGLPLLLHPSQRGHPDAVLQLFDPDAPPPKLKRPRKTAEPTGGAVMHWRVDPTSGIGEDLTEPVGGLLLAAAPPELRLIRRAQELAGGVRAEDVQWPLGIGAEDGGAHDVSADDPPEAPLPATAPSPPAHAALTEDDWDRLADGDDGRRQRARVANRRRFAPLEPPATEPAVPPVAERERRCRAIADEVRRWAAGVVAALPIDLADGDVRDEIDARADLRGAGLASLVRYHLAHEWAEREDALGVRRPVAR